MSLSCFYLYFIRHAPQHGWGWTNGSPSYLCWSKEILFTFSGKKYISDSPMKLMLNLRSIACLLIFNNLMVIVSSLCQEAWHRSHRLNRVPQRFLGSASRELVFSEFLILEYRRRFCSPFHAAMGIVTCRMLIHLRKFNELILFGSAPASKPGRSLRFAKSMQDTHASSTTADLERSAFKDKNHSQSARSVWLDSDSERTVSIQFLPYIPPLIVSRDRQGWEITWTLNRTLFP